MRPARTSGCGVDAIETRRSPAGLKPRRRSLLGLSSLGFHRIAYLEWGEPDNPRVLICVHGLTRNARDFDELAASLARDYRVVCPDIVGRGDSDWLADASLYAYPQYVADMTALLARLDAKQVDWLGTSMGGLIGMMLAAQRNSPIHRLVLNDVGPFIPRAALKRIAQYAGRGPVFPTLELAERYLREVHAAAGALSDAQWRRLSRYGVRARAEEGFVLHYDRKLAQPFRRGASADMDLWEIWDRVSCPVLVLRGAASDLLLRETAAAMTKRGPRAEVVEIPGHGHAPWLKNAEEIELVARWLLRRRLPPGQVSKRG